MSPCDERKWDSLAKHINDCKNILLAQGMTECEFVASYVILWNQHLNPLQWIGGRFKPNEPSKYFSLPFCCHKYHNHCFKERKVNTGEENYAKFLFKNIPGLALSVKQSGKLADLEKITISDFMKNYSLFGVPKFVQDCLVNWFNDNRPFILRFDIPSSEEVLHMMVRGGRCISVLTEDLGQILKDDYPPFKSRNPLEFLYHDLQHMEQFVEANFYEEQVGFLGTFEKWYPAMLKFPEFSFDDEFVQDINHLVSDMNSCCIHLFKFFRAKWIGAKSRSIRADRLDDQQMQQFKETEFHRYLSWLTDASATLCEILKKDDLKHEDCEKIRSYFAQKGRQCLGLNGLDS